jgi:dolichol-phosphate mannosyltransferase
MLATSAPYLAVIDGDMQHDETLLPRMLEALKRGDLDLVVGSRNLNPEGMGEGLSEHRVRLSQMGAGLARLLRGTRELTDPMSGFFLIDRRFLEEVIHRTSGIGFKVLVDLVASSTRPVRFTELPYQFRKRMAGESKLDLSVSIELVYLIADKALGGIVPVRYLMFAAAGLPGLVLHLGILGSLTQMEGTQFLNANVAATLCAMTLNFFVNNSFTYRDQRLRGVQILSGLLTFYAACSIGAIVSFVLAQFLYSRGAAWWIAGLFGMTVASVWNFAVTGLLAWRRKRGGQPYS